MLTPEIISLLPSIHEYKGEQRLNQVLKEPDVDPLLIMPMFILDFLCIHPFRDGNGRMSRLLTLLLLNQGGYYVGKYISIEKLIEQTKAELVEQVPDVSQTTVQRTFTELTKQGRIIKLGSGRYIKYRWNWDQEDELQ